MTPESKIYTAASENYRWKTFIVAASALFVLVVDMSVTTISLSKIADDLSITLRSVAWVVIISSLTMCGVMLPMGRLADVIGRKKFHIIGLIIFTVGCFLTGLSTSLPFLLFGRFVMAFGSAICQAVAFAIIIGVFPDRQRGKALGIITTTVGLAGIVGPLMSGLLIPLIDWRGMFLLLGFSSIISLTFAYFILDEKVIGIGGNQSILKYDWIGAILSALFFVMLIVAISNPFSIPWISLVYFGIVLVILGCLGTLIFWELRTSAPMIDVRIFLNATFSWSTSVRLLAFTGNSAVFFLMPIFVQSFLGLSPMYAGFTLFSTSAGIAISSLFSGRLSDKHGFNVFVVSGITLTLVTGVLFAQVDGNTDLRFLISMLFFNGIGMGLWMAPNMTATLGTVSRNSHATFSALLNLIRNIGTAIGQALATAVITGVMLVKGSEVELHNLAQQSTPLVQDSFLLGWKLAYWILAVVMFLALFSALVLMLKTRNIKVSN